MYASSPIPRRHVLLAGGATVATIWLRPWRTFIQVVGVSPEERLAGLLPMSDSTRRVGSAYLRTVTAEADTSLLVRALVRAIGVELSALPADLAAPVRAAISDELRRRDVIRIDGWVASPTEARLAALATLIADQRA